jgi:hypothetical protein
MVWIIDRTGFAVGSNFTENDTALMRKRDMTNNSLRY